jgi:hypothetical protein
MAIHLTFRILVTCIDPGLTIIALPKQRLGSVGSKIWSFHIYLFESQSNDGSVSNYNPVGVEVLLVSLGQGHEIVPWYMERHVPTITFYRAAIESYT